jgi:hypothetical protein
MRVLTETIKNFNLVGGFLCVGENPHLSFGHPLPEGEEDILQE